MPFVALSALPTVAVPDTFGTTLFTGAPLEAPPVVETVTLTGALMRFPALSFATT